VEANRLSANEALSFSLKDTTGPEIDAPSRFARALKRARFARGWTQAQLSKQLSITKRSIVSWETGARIPSVGMVVLLLDVLNPEEDLSLHQELLCAYIVDDLERQESRKDPEQHQNDLLLQRAQRVIELVLQLPERATQARAVQESQVVEEQAVPRWEEHEPVRPQKKIDDQQMLEPLFALMDQLHQHPDLITVARDFIGELIPDGSLPTE
jgi:transcriptional regulator with XRE-family HTH domain